MKITNLLTIKNYEAGRDGNLLVSLDEEMVVKAYRVNDKTMNVRPLICTAYVRDPHDQEILAKHVDGNTPVDRVIIVSKKFQSLWNKTQLILLEKQNAMEDITDPDNDLETQVYAEIAAMAKFGAGKSKRAFRKARKILENDENKVGAAMHKSEKKRAAEAKKNIQKAKKQKLGDIMENEDDWKDISVEKEANQKSVKSDPKTFNSATAPA